MNKKWRNKLENTIEIRHVLVKLTEVRNNDKPCTKAPYHSIIKLEKSITIFLQNHYA